MKNASILLIISGGIAAYKSLELIRLMRKSGGRVRCILTQGGAQFVTPLSVSALCEEPVYTDLWSLKDESEMGHIRLSREADLILIAPASANMIARMAHGMADDLATTTLLAADKPVIIAPAMNHKMWEHPATQANIATLKSRGVMVIGPDEGDMACGEYGFGRMSEVSDILNMIQHALHPPHPALPPMGGGKRGLASLEALPAVGGVAGALAGYKALITSGPTFEPLDPVRFIGNRSSGKQGHAIATALAHAGADVTLISGPVSLPDPLGVKTIHVETAAQMLKACENALPADIAICAAAVSDWTPETLAPQKIKKSGKVPSLTLKENPDILKTISHHKNRPDLVIGFAAETENLLNNARTKLKTKGCDWILANNVAENTFGFDTNHIIWLSHKLQEDWEQNSKASLAERLVQKIASHFKERKSQSHAAK